ncbi:MAG: MBL fold metallo-hydrolase [Verrucomicrobiota bacterium]
MKIWGCRGSIPTALTPSSIREKMIAVLEGARGRELKDRAAVERFIDEELPFRLRSSYGGETSCVQLAERDAEFLIADAGSGLRKLSSQLLRQGELSEPKVFHILISHLHWDHIQGFPFFAPAYMPQHTVVFHGHHADIEKAIRGQMGAPWFPVGDEALRADLNFNIKPEGAKFELLGFEIDSLRQKHPGTSYGYRLRQDGKTIVYSSDSEHKEDAFDEEYRFIEFIRGADLLIFDAQYNLLDATFSKADWGHSSNVMAAQLAVRAGVKHTVLFHHDPESSDEDLDHYLAETLQFAEAYRQEHPRMAEAAPGQKISLAHDGLTLLV